MRSPVLLAALFATPLLAQLRGPESWQLARTMPRALESPFAVAPSLQALLAWQAAATTPPSEAQRTALVLAYLATGATMRSGPHKDPLRKLIIEQHAIDPWPVPIAVADHALTALATVRCFHWSQYKLLQRDCRACIERLRTHLTDSTTEPLRPDTLAVLYLLASEAKQSGAHDEAGDASLRAALQQARVAWQRGKNRRDDAANLLADRLAGKPVDDDLLLATCWPANVAADPMHTWLGVVAALQVAPVRAAATLPQLAPLVQARKDGGEHAGTWEPAAGYDRITTTALFTMSLALANQALAK